MSTWEIEYYRDIKLTGVAVDKVVNRALPLVLICDVGEIAYYNSFAFGQYPCLAEVPHLAVNLVHMLVYILDKQDCGLSDERDRLAMVQLAIEGVEGLKASDFEFQLPRPSYTLNTLRALEEAYPDRDFSLLIGADNWEKFDRWYKGDEILAHYGVVIYPRGGEGAPQLPSGAMWLPAALYDVSSTMVRAAVASGNSIEDYVPQAVANYIYNKKMYLK